MGEVRGRRLEWMAVPALLVLSVVVHISTFDQVLAERHGFRQTQTAYTAVEFYRHGIDLWNPRLPVLGRPFLVPFEFPLFQAFATIPMHLGISADTSMRVTGMAFFLLTGVLLFGMLRYVANRIVAYAALGAFLFCPFGLLWSRTSLPEYLATAGAVAFAWRAIVWRDSGHARDAVIAIAAGSMGMAVKPATAAFWIIPVLAYHAAGETSGLRAWVAARAKPVLAAIVVVPLTTGLIWSLHADSVKDASPATAWLTNTALRTWYMGTLSDRLSAAKWIVILDRVQMYIVGPYIWMGIIVIALIATRPRAFWVGVLLALVLPPLIFFNAYWVHDYYLAAITPAAAALLGMTAGWIAQQLPKHRPSGVSVGLAGAAVLALWLGPLLVGSASYWRLMFEPAGNSYTDAAVEIDQLTKPGSLVVVQVDDWDPTTLYYARRRGMMLEHRSATPEVLAALPHQGYDYWYSFNPAGPGLEELDRWEWVGVVGPHTYELGNRGPDAQHAPVIAATSSATMTTPPTGARALTAGLDVPCSGARVPLPRGAMSTWVAVDGAPQPNVRIWVDDALAPLPWVRALELRPTAAAGAAPAIWCTGTSALHVTVFDVAAT